MIYSCDNATICDRLGYYLDAQVAIANDLNRREVKNLIELDITERTKIELLNVFYLLSIRYSSDSASL